MKLSSFHLILSIIAQMSLSIESCTTDEEEITVVVTAEFYEQSTKSVSTYRKTVQSDSTFNKLLNKLAVSASVSATYKGFSAAASASFESLTDSVTSREDYSETVQSEKMEFNTDFLRIVREIVTTVKINEKSASTIEKKFVDSITTGKSLAELNKKAKDYMARRFGKQADGNKFEETICQEKSKVSVSQISIKTGKGKSQSSDCDAFMEICDANNNCCETTFKKGGLDDSYKNDREKGEVDIYTEKALLKTCSELSLVPGGLWKAKLITGGKKGKDGWFVDWVRIYTGESKYDCPMRAWLNSESTRSMMLECTPTDLEVDDLC